MDGVRSFLATTTTTTAVAHNCSGRRESSESRDLFELCSYSVHRYFVIGFATARSVSSQGARGGASKYPPNPKLSPAQALFYELI